MRAWSSTALSAAAGVSLFWHGAIAFVFSGAGRDWGIQLLFAMAPAVVCLSQALVTLMASVKLPDVRRRISRRGVPPADDATSRAPASGTAR